VGNIVIAGEFIAAPIKRFLMLQIKYIKKVSIRAFAEFSLKMDAQILQIAPFGYFLVWRS